MFSGFSLIFSSCSNDLLPHALPFWKRPDISRWYTRNEDKSFCSPLWRICILRLQSHCGKEGLVGEIRASESKKGEESVSGRKDECGCPWSRTVFLQICFSDLRPPQRSNNILYFLLAENPIPNSKVTFWSWVSSLLWWMDVFEWTERSVPLLKIKYIDSIFKGCRAETLPTQTFSLL